MRILAAGSCVGSSVVRSIAFAGLVGALASSATIHAQVAGAFDAARSTPIPGGTDSGQGLLAADFDGDGDLDVAAELSNANRIGVLLNRGGGQLAPAATYAGEIYPSGLLSGDFDGDGDVDLFALDEGPLAALVYSNRGDGTFDPAVGHAAGYHPRSAGIGDFDGDGRADVAVITADGYQTPAQLRILRNDGAGGFATTLVLPLYARQLRALDIDGDQDVDLVGIGVDDLVVLRNRGDGTFEIPQSWPVGEYMDSLQLGDLDGDGDPDAILLQRNYGSLSHVFAARNLGGGVFAKPEFVTPLGSQSSITLADLDGDDRLDLMSHESGPGLLKVFRGRGDATFELPREFALDAGLMSILAVDLDGDGDPDLAGMAVDQLVLIENRGDGRFVVEERNSFPNGVRVLSADLDGDGDPDLVGDDENSLEVRLNRGNGVFDIGAPLSGSSHSYDFELVDIDGDGDIDIASFWEFASALTIRRNHGDGTFGVAEHTLVGGSPIAMAAGDVDADGDVDVVMSMYALLSNDIVVFVLVNRADGTFERGDSFATEDPIDFVHLVDIDGDGDLDLAFANRWGGSPKYVRNDGSGRFDASHAQELPEGAVFGPAFVDLDLDGDVDVVSSTYPASLTLSRNRGDGTFEPEVQIASGVELSAWTLVAFDIDGDGDLDLTNGVLVLENDGQLHFEVVDRILAATNLYSPTLAIDVDADGDEDLVLARDLRVIRNGSRIGSPFALGDGSGTPCPCGNVGAIGNGCANSVNTQGAQLRASGNARLADDSLVLHASGTAHGAALWIQGSSSTNGGLGAPFGDGLLGVSGTIRRLGVTQTNAGSASYPHGFARPVHELGAIIAPGTRTYQLIYRDNASFCTSLAFNATNALTVTWIP